MKTPLPQQKLLLELLVMSGDIAVTVIPDESVLWRTLRECKMQDWISVKEISPGITKVSITKLGRELGQDHGNAQTKAS